MTHYTRFSARASLGAVGVYMRHRKMWRVIERHVHIKQKVLKHKPTDKILDAFINILAGGHGLVEVKTRVKPDEPLQRAFGRQGCADQSTISDTFNACTAENVKQMRQALQELHRTHSLGYQHNYEQGLQVLDLDMTGMPSGHQGEGATKGYFSRKRGRRGRQLGRVLATQYDEIVIGQLFPGKVQLTRSLRQLVAAADKVLALDQDKRKQTLIRVDGGGGKDKDINWLLARGYHVLTKVNNWKRAAKLARSVTEWHTDPKTGDRQVGWVTDPHAYVRPTHQLAVRTPKKDNSWLYWVLVFTLSDEQLCWLARRPMVHEPTPEQRLFVPLYAYDLRSGGVENSIKNSKQGLGLTKRNKRSFVAQEMLVLSAQLAYNLLSWLRNHLAVHYPRLRSYGPLRMVRDVLQITGKFRLDSQGRILEIVLNQAHPLAKPFERAVSTVLAWDDCMLNLGEI